MSKRPPPTRPAWLLGQRARGPAGRSPWAWAVLVWGLVATAAWAAPEADNGSGGMFGLFKRKSAAQAETAVNPDVGAPLVAAGSFPTAAAPALPPGAPRCDKVAVEGKPPAARIAAAAVPGQTSGGYRVSGLSGQPSLVFVNRPGKRSSFELWGLAAGADAPFQQQRPVVLDPAQARWAGYLLLGVGCLAAEQVLVAVHYNEPEPRDALYLYDSARNNYHRLGAVEPDTSAGLPYRYFETLAAGPSTSLVRHGSLAQRLAPEVYVNQLNHVLLVSARYPQGLEVLRLAVSDGNIRRWALKGRTLWLATTDDRDARKPVHKVWSLDLSRVLP